MNLVGLIDCWEEEYEEGWARRCPDSESRAPGERNYLTAGTDEVSMGMVKRVLYTATGGSCRDPEAVSYCRNETGAIDI